MDLRYQSCSKILQIKKAALPWVHNIEVITTTTKAKIELAILTVFMSGCELHISSTFNQFGLSYSSSLTWKPHIHCIAKHVSQKLSFLSRACGYFSPQLELCANLRFDLLSSAAPISEAVLLNFLSKIQSTATLLIKNPNLTNSLQSLSYRCLVPDLSIF